MPDYGWSASVAGRSIEEGRLDAPPLPPLSAGSHAGILDEYGTAITSASIALAIVFAVYMPPHAPGPGHALRTTLSRSSSEALPATYSP